VGPGQSPGKGSRGDEAPGSSGELVILSACTVIFGGSGKEIFLIFHVI